jgi:hypothetical protein
MVALESRIAKIEKMIGESECTCRDQGLVVVCADDVNDAAELSQGIDCPSHGRQLLRLVVISSIDARL